MQACHANRSSSCLSTCTEVAYRICVPGIDPFDACVTSCVANKTYVAPTKQLEHQLAVCKKRLRLTPSLSGRRGAAWYRHKQRVRGGFRTDFAFKLDHPSRRCATTVHPSHAERAETHDNLCRDRGGDGFAFVVQDAGLTSFEPECALGVVSECVDSEAAVCVGLCRGHCPVTAAQEGGACAATCLRGAEYLFPRVAAAVAPPSDEPGRPAFDAAAIEAALGMKSAAAAAAAACEPHVGACVGACTAAQLSTSSAAALAGTGPMDKGGCLRTCLGETSFSWCAVAPAKCSLAGC